MHDYSACYATLGVTPDTDWKTLRARYRRLIGQWHPDRYSADATGKKVAEERTKHITLAYQTLERYRRDHGVLPPSQPALAAVGGKTPGPDAGTRFDRASSTSRAEAATADAAVEGVAKPRPRRWRRLAIALVALGTATYFALDSFKELEPSKTEPVESAHEADTAPQSPPSAEIPQGAGGIRLGSTFGEVYTIQGVPNSTQGDTWHYGKSQIRFAQGKVISWEEHVDNPLRIDRDQAILRRERFFGVGSTKDEVRAVQGAPVTETDNVWYYAPSKVYFEHNRVVRWEESPMQPLRVAR
jgi:hypothetical protein